MSYSESQQRQPTSMGGNIPEYSVEEISQGIKKAIELQFNRIRVRGEASGVSKPQSGHIYLQLVQKQHKLDAVIWRSRAQSLSLLPENGGEYVVTGKLTSYSGRSSYQMIIDQIEAAGEGELLARFERLKAELAAEGLFEASHKKPIPTLPEVIGVVTSPDGAVIRDIQNVLRDRFPRHVLVWPAAVQGTSCPEEVAMAIRGFNLLDHNGPVPRPDLIIVARGGGSVEDLAGFNEEIVVRAAFDSTIPLISAVGHETDWSLIDLAADLRAPTPSVAAEKAVPSRAEITARLHELESRLTKNLVGKTENWRQRLRDLSRGLPRPDAIFAIPSQRIDHAAQSLSSSMRGHLQANQIRLAKIADHLRRPQIIQASEKRFSIAAAKLDWRLIKGLVKSNQERFTSVTDKIDRAHGTMMQGHRQKLSELQRLLNSMSYEDVLRRGYAVVRDECNQIVDTRAEAAEKKRLKIEFQDGKIGVEAVPDNQPLI